MSLIKIVITSIVLSWSAFIYSAPPIEILQTCKNNLSTDDTITIKEIEGIGYNDQPEAGCSYQYDTYIDGKIFGSVTCNDVLHFIIGGKKISTSSAYNYSTTSWVKPTIPIPQVSWWWIINAPENKTYICVQAPLSDSGSAANLYRYFLIEDPFNLKLTTNNIYFYYFEDTYKTDKQGNGKIVGKS